MTIDIPEQSFGTLFTCNSCQAVFFVDWNGQPEAPQDLGDFQTPSSSPEVESPQGSEPLAPSFDFGQPLAETPAFDPPPMENPTFEAMTPEAPTFEMPPADAMAQESSFSEPESNDVSSAIAVSPTPDFKEVVDYGNDLESNKVMSYTVYVKGIEISSMREKFREALTDSRFAWDVDSLLDQITDGSIVFSDLSPAKAVVLINRIKYLGVDVSWKQKVLS